MKTINKIAALLVAVLVLQVATACQKGVITSKTESSLQNNDGSPQVIQLDKYSILLYQNATGSDGDTVTPRYTGEEFYAQENYSKSNATTKRVNISGNKINMSYIKSTKINMYKDDIDIYETTYADRLLRIEYNERTGKIARYIRYAPCTDREYKSEVSPKSNEKDFIEYAKKILLDEAGISVEGRNTTIATKIIKEDGSNEYASCFVNYSDIDLNFNAEYTFKFSSSIDEIKRADDVSITITNVGEICSLTALVNDDAYLPFENVKIDQTLINTEVEKAFLNVKNLYDVKSYNVSLLCLPTDTELWVEASVAFSFQGGEENTILESGVKYLIKVAELK